MKHLLICLLAAFSVQLSAFSAAPPVVVVESSQRVLVNGQDAGKPADTIRNRPELASAIQLALEKREAERAAALAEVQSKLAAALAANATLLQKLQSAKSDVELAAVRDEAVKPGRDKKRAELEAELEAKKRELDALK